MDWEFWGPIGLIALLLGVFGVLLTCAVLANDEENAQYKAAMTACMERGPQYQLELGVCADRACHRWVIRRICPDLKYGGD